jgi:hypothetical protein
MAVMLWVSHRAAKWGQLLQKLSLTTVGFVLTKGVLPPEKNF